ncbi:hypothetical protein ABZW47_10680 [Streptomyces sp. NPDC004549]|uniref:hypothetical protein n=1 Tax=unclassified Streptomyces TaxID=2593676 RepID=UPI0018F3D0A2|nr:hypothetical protein [Streptomyces sp. DSM 110735]MBJ7904563.1 hypothetical protein [Streptomyces sp. DSM 110735]
MSSARRPLLTATAAGTLLCALWFVPSANASQDGLPRDVVEQSAVADSSTRITQQTATVSGDTGRQVTEETELADTGSFDTTPYVVTGTLLLAVGAGFVVYSVRRERLGF